MIVGYYNTGYEGWETSLRDYTRNNFAPYLLEFDYIPEIKFDKIEEDLKPYVEKIPENVKDFNKPEQPLDAYKNNYFIINMLKFKMRNIIGLTAGYNQLLDYANNLNNSIDQYLNNI